MYSDNSIPLVDILVSSYNPRAPLVKRAIESIVAQTYPNWHLHLINDGSPVDFAPILQTLHDPRISFYDRPHQGKAAALNYALRHCHGALVAYLDDDDIWYPQHLEVAVDYLLKNELDFVHTDSLSITLKNVDNTWKEIYRSTLHHGIITDKTMNHLGHITVVHKRDLLELVGGYDETRTIYIDWEFFLRVAKHCTPVHIPLVTCENYYYLNETNQLENPVSSRHCSDLLFSKQCSTELFRQAYSTISADDFAQIAQELVDTISLNRSLVAKCQHLQEQLQDLEFHAWPSQNSDNSLLRPTAITFPNDYSEHYFRGSWHPQSVNENYRWINKHACVEMTVPSDHAYFYAEGYLPEEFSEVSLVTVYLNELPFASYELSAGQAFSLNLPLPEGLCARTMIKVGLEFDGTHSPERSAADQRTLSALITKLALLERIDTPC